MNMRMKNMILALVAAVPMLLSIGCSKDGGGGGQTAVVANQNYMSNGQCYQAGTATVLPTTSCPQQGYMTNGQCYQQGTNVVLPITSCQNTGNIGGIGQIGGIGNTGNMPQMQCVGQFIDPRTGQSGYCNGQTNCRQMQMIMITPYGQQPVFCM